MANVLILSNIRVFDDAGMATGPGLRAWGMATALSARGHETVLAEPQIGPSGVRRAERESVRLAWWQQRSAEMRRLVQQADVVIVQPCPAIAFALADLQPRCLVVDLYNPVITEYLALTRPSDASTDEFKAVLRSYRSFMHRGDYFLCAGERQRQFTLGALAHAGRLNLLTDPNDLLRLVPMGVESAAPAPLDEKLIRGRIVPPNAELLLWPGGIYRWFEAVTAVRALEKVRQSRPHAVMVFVGAENPLEPAASSPGFPEARAAARELGLLGVHLHFVPWLPYEKRSAMYHEADLAVLTHRPLLEAQFAWRTRTLDCFWGGLPLVVTEGDEVGEIGERAGAALCVPPEDPDALAEAIRDLLADPTRRASMGESARKLAVERWSWKRVTEPLHEICLRPHPAPDREAVGQHLGIGLAARPVPPTSPGRVCRRATRSVAWRLSRLQSRVTGRSR
jgi:glycosyltransferase involved in cell wall biosynthesis